MYENFIAAFNTFVECSFFKLEVVNWSKSAFFKFIAMEIFVRSAQYWLVALWSDPCGKKKDFGLLLFFYHYIEFSNELTYI